MHGTSTMPERVVHSAPSHSTLSSLSAEFTAMCAAHALLTALPTAPVCLLSNVPQQDTDIMKIAGTNDRHFVDSSLNCHTIV